MSHNELPIHPTTGLRALGYTSRGPIWPAIGGSEDHEGGNDGGSNNGGQQAAGQSGSDGAGTGDGFTPITSQEELDKVLGKRLDRERAKFPDYDQLKADAAELKKIRDGEKTELQREKEAREAAEARADKAEFAALRSEVARDKGVPAASITGTTKEELEASAEELLAWRGDAGKPTKPAKNTNAGQLKSGASGAGSTTQDPKERAAEAMRRLRNGD